MKSLADQFLDYGISFKAGQISVDARIYRLNTYIESGKLKIFSNCTFLNNELSNYRWPERKIGDSNSRMNKPVDKDNHSINGLEWIVMELPSDPRKLLFEVYGKGGQKLRTIAEEENAMELPWQLADDEDDRSGRSMRWW